MSANFQKLQRSSARQDKVKSRMAAVDKVEADFEERVAQTQVWFGEARDELRAAQGELEERKRELILKQADIEKAQGVAKDLAAKDEAAGNSRRPCWTPRRRTLPLVSRRSPPRSAARTRRSRSSACSRPRSWGRSTKMQLMH